MEFVVLILMCIAEIGLILFTLMKQKEKKQWLLNRSIVSAGELAIYLVLLLFPGVDFTFRYKVFFFVLLFRALLSALINLIKHAKVNGNKHVASIIFSGVLGILLLGLSLIPAFLFRDYNGLPTSGSHEVAMLDAILVDPNRIESFETDGSHREVPIHVYYPADADGSEQYPLVVFSHGAFGYYQSNTSTYMELASNGYVVISLDHPYHSFFTQDTDGKVITVNQDFIHDAFYINGDGTPEQEIFDITSAWVTLRVDDINLVLDTIINSQASNSLDSSWYLGDTDENEILHVLSIVDCDKIGLMGHSLGGCASVTVGRNREGIDAVIDLDGTMMGEETNYNADTNTYDYIEEPYPVPLLSIISQSHHESCQALGVLYVNYEVMANAADGHETYFVNSAHMNFTDLPLFSPILAKKLGTGTIDAQHAVETMNTIVLDYMNYYLKGEGTLNIQESYE